MQKRQSDMTNSGDKRTESKTYENKAVYEQGLLWHRPCSIRARKLEALVKVLSYGAIMRDRCLHDLLAHHCPNGGIVPHHYAWIDDSAVLSA
jgi:hypothetical protein